MSVGSWLGLGLAYLAGVAAAVTLGQIAPVAGQVRGDLGLSLAQLGWVISAVTMVAALLGTPAGLWIGRRGGRRALVTGLVVLAAAVAGSAATQGMFSLLASRAVAGIGYLLVVVAGPVLVAGLADDCRRAAALSLWGACIPAGLAVSAIAGGLAGPSLGWRVWLVASSALPTVLALAVILLVPADPSYQTAERHPLRLVTLGAPLLLAAAFCGISLIGVSALALLPTYLVERGAGVAFAGSATGAVAIASIPGSLLAAALLRRGRSTRQLSPSTALMPLAAVPLFALDLPMLGTVAAAIVLLLVNGLLVAAMFAAVPRLIARREDLAVANGVVAQLGSLGALVGPPLFGAAVATAGWPALVVVIGMLAALSLAVLLKAEQRRPTPPLAEE